MIARRLSSEAIKGNIEEGLPIPMCIAGLSRETKPVRVIVEDITAAAERIIDTSTKLKA